MKLSFSTNAFTRHKIFEAVERIASIGYAGVEVLADVPHFFADAVTHEEIAKLQETLSRTGLRVANINGNTAVGYYGRDFWEPLFEPSLANPDSSARNWRIAYSKKCIDLAHQLGSSNVSLTSGRLIPGVTLKQSRQLLCESLCEVLDYAAKSCVRVGIEYEPGLLIERCEELLALMNLLNSPLLGVNLDLGHSYLLGEEPAEVIEALGDRIFHIHLEDIKGRKHYHLIPGEGDIDFERHLRILHDHAYGGFVTVELYTYPDCPEEAARAAFDHLSPLTQRISGEG